MAIRTRTLAAILLAGLLLLMVAGPAVAHEDRTVGPFQLTWGLGNEEVAAGDKTFFEADITQAGKPVVFTAAELKQSPLVVHVFVGAVKASPELAAKQPGGKPFELTLQPVPWCAGCGPGHYQTQDFRFSDPGPYTAHLHTPIAGVAGATKTVRLRGQVVDEQFPMAEGKYGPVHDPTERMWPNKTPTLAALATRVDREASRVAGLHNAETHGSAAAQSTANTAAGLGVAGAVLGAIALVVAVTGRRRRPAAAPPVEDRAHASR